MERICCIKKQASAKEDAQGIRLPSYRFQLKAAWIFTMQLYSLRSFYKMAEVTEKSASRYPYGRRTCPIPSYRALCILFPGLLLMNLL